MSDNEQDLRSSIDQALHRASLSVFASDRETLLRLAISLRKKACEPVAPEQALEPA